MAPPVEDVKNWMNMFRWIVKLIRDDYGVDESILTRTAVLESDCGLVMEDIEAVMQTIATSFAIRFPEGTLDEVVKLEELCVVSSWLKGLYKQPDFVSAGFAERGRSLNPAAG